MSQWQVPRTARRDGEGDSGQIRLGPYRDERCLAQLLQHRRQLCRIIDDLRIGELRRSGHGPRVAVRLALFGSDGGEVGKLGNESAEFELGEQFGQSIDLRRLYSQLLEIELHRNVAPQRDELAG